MFSSSDVIINIPKSECDEEKENFYNIQYDLISESDRYEEAIKREKKCCVIPDMTLNICVFASTSLNEPAIQINDGCDHRISFNVFEWFEFTKTLVHIIEEEEKEITTQFWENFTINVIPINYKSNDSFKTRKITLTKNSTYLMLMEEDIIEILRIDTLLSAKLEMLHKLNFFTYYYNVA
jgi:hypothetical protein